MASAIKVQGLTKGFGRKAHTKALDSISIDIQEGETFGLLGPNGAGKTTFVRCVLGLLKPTSGSVELFGAPPTFAAARQRVGFAPEVPHFPGLFSAPEILAMHSRLISQPSDLAYAQHESLLDEAELTDAPKRVKDFSKGMVRRLAIAQALLGEPKMLVLDEPTADLDPIGRRDIRNRLIDLKSQGVTVLLNSHLLSEVERLCDRVAIIHKGRLLAMGSIDEIVPEGQDLETAFVDLVERSGG